MSSGRVPRRRAGADVPGWPARAAPGWGGARVLAVGHSTRPFEELVALLRSCGVATVADVRTVPRSRHNPQFERSALERTLPAAGLRYVHLPRLGGLRRPRPDSPNAGWRNASFRGYADHMQTAEFEEGLEELRALAREGPVALLCAEAVPWRCHRSLIADALLARGLVVEHILRPGVTRRHRPTPFAVRRGRRVLYPDPTGAAPPPRRQSRRGPTPAALGPAALRPRDRADDGRGPCAAPSVEGLRPSPALSRGAPTPPTTPPPRAASEAADGLSPRRPDPGRRRLPRR